MDNNNVVLISCSSIRAGIPCEAQYMYRSELFKLSLKYAKSINPFHIFILSAKYGLLELNERIEPNCATLNNMTDIESKKWACDVLNQLKKKVNIATTNFIFLAFENYWSNLIDLVEYSEIPMKGMNIGKQMQFLQQTGS